MTPKYPLSPLAATCLVALAAGCASTPPATPEPAAAVAVAAASPHAVSELDLGAKFKMPNRERGRRDRAVMNAQYHLELEADEKGPPSVEQIFRAYQQRSEITRATGLATQEKSA